MAPGEVPTQRHGSASARTVFGLKLKRSGVSQKKLPATSCQFPARGSRRPVPIYREHDVGRGGGRGGGRGVGRDVGRGVGRSFEKVSSYLHMSGGWIRLQQPVASQKKSPETSCQVQVRVHRRKLVCWLTGNWPADQLACW